VNGNNLKITAWSLSAATSIVAVIAWGQLYDWRIGSISTYQWFPLFGLLAFSLMWSHYIVGVLRQLAGVDKIMLKTYFESTSLVVLVSLLLHPGLLGWQLWRDGIGLPPGSYKFYVGSALYIWILAGLLSWIIFATYELRRKYSMRSWWTVVERASDLGMTLIYFHALKLGSHLQSGWFKYVWYFYGITLAISLIYIYYNLLRRHKRA
jgi:hypothetical protein